MLLFTAAVMLAYLPQTVPQVQQREIHEPGVHYAIDVKYPEIQRANRFNAAVHRALDEVTNKFKRAMSKETASKETAADGPVDGYLKGTYHATLLKHGVVSVLLDFDIYIPGAAHPSGEMVSINYDHRSGRVLALSDLFRSGVNYLPRLSQLAMAALDQNEFADRHAIRQGAGPDERNFQVFPLTDTALVLHFPTYQVAAGAAGPQRVIIPLDKLVPSFGNLDSLRTNHLGRARDLID